MYLTESLNHALTWCVAVILLVLAFGCSSNEESANDFGAKVYNAIVSQDTSAILKCRLTTEDAKEITSLPVIQQTYQGIVRKVNTNVIEGEMNFLKSFGIRGERLSYVVKDRKAIAECKYDSLQLGDSTSYSESITRYKNSHIWHTITDTAGKSDHEMIELNEIWKIDGELKILKF